LDDFFNEKLILFFTVGGGVQHVQAPPPPPQETSAYMPPVSSGPGWNDPPPMSMFTSKSKGITSKPSPHVPLVHGDPITQPVFGGSVPAPPTFQSPDLMMMQPQYQQQQQPLYGGGAVQQPVFEPK
jgi:hypothetical protein